DVEPDLLVLLVEIVVGLEVERHRGGEHALLANLGRQQRARLLVDRASTGHGREHEDDSKRETGKHGHGGSSQNASTRRGLSIRTCRSSSLPKPFLAKRGAKLSNK